MRNIEAETAHDYCPTLSAVIIRKSG